MNGDPQSKPPSFRYPMPEPPKRIPVSVPVEVKPRRNNDVSIPFKIRSGGDSLVAEAGVFDSAEIPEKTQSNPTNGTWYYQASVTINNTTGVITDLDTDWVTSEGVNSSTTFYRTVGRADVVGGDVDPESIINFTYGPLFVVVYGAVDEKWAAQIY